MRRKIFIMTLALALGFGMIVTPALAFTDDTDNTYVPRYQTKAAYGNGYGKYFAGTTHDTVAGTIGLSDDDLYALRLEGKSIAQIANENGITTESLTSTLTLAKIDQIEQLFNDGIITAETKDYMISQAEDRTIYKINKTEIGGQGYGNKGQGKSMRYSQDGEYVPGQGKINGGGYGYSIYNQ